jgi:hypothetical protein
VGWGAPRRDVRTEKNEPAAHGRHRRADAFFRRSSRISTGARTHDRAGGIDLPLWATVLPLDNGETRAAIVDLKFP